MQILKKNLKPLSLILFLYGLLCYLAVIAKSYQIIKFPYVIDYGESTILFQIKLIFEGHFPYEKAAADVANYFTYTPLFQAILSIAGSDPVAWLMEARILNTVSMLAVGAFVSKFYIDWKGQPVKFIDWALPFLLWLSWYPVFNWTGMGRLDGPALLLQFAGLYFYLQQKTTKKPQYVAMTLFALAFFVKQSAIWIPVSLLIYDGRNKKFDMSWLLYGGLIVSGLVGLSAFSEGTLWAHLWSSNNNNYKIEYLLDALKANGVFHFGVLVVALIGMTTLKLRGKDFLIVSMAAMSLPYVIGMGREGSGSNFLLEFCVILTLFTLRGIERLEKSIMLSSVAALFVVISCWDNFKFRTYFLNDPGAPTFITAWSNEAKVSTDVVVEKIANSKGDVWSENPSLIIFAGKETALFPFENKQAIARGRIDEKIFSEEISQRKVSLVVQESGRYGVPVQRFSDGILKAISENYKITYQNEFYTLLEPAK